MQPFLRSLPLSLLLAAPAFAAGDPCDVAGSCHLPAWTPPGLAFSHQAGAAVALGATTALVGTPGAGAVHVYERVADTWVFVETLMDPLGGGNAFGTAVALDGQRAYVGAPSTDAGAPDSGAVYMYERGVGGFEPRAMLVDLTPTIGGRLGASLDASNTWVAAGAPGDDGIGHVHVWSFESGEAQYLQEVGFSASQEELGSSVALYRAPGAVTGYLFAGDWGDTAMGLNAGAVRQYTVSAFGVGVGTVLRPAGLEAGDLFGTAIAFDGEHLVVGARGDDETASGGGAAYVYDVELGPISMTLATKLVACNADIGDAFGFSVAIEGGRIAVGAIHQDHFSAKGGKVHLFRPAIFGSSWVVDRVLEPSDATGTWLFGRSVALSGDLVLVGAPFAAHAGASAGAAYLFSTLGDSLPGGECPSPSLAAVHPFGSGKHGAAGIPELSLTSPLTPGESSVMVLRKATPGTQPLLFYGFQMGFVPFDAGTLYMTDPNWLLLPTVGAIGQVGMNFALPADPVLAGVRVVFQAMAVDPGAVGTFQTAQSNGLDVWVGY